MKQTDCAHFQDMLDDYRRDLLDDNERTAVAGHLDNCAICSDELRFREELANQMRSTLPPIKHGKYHLPLELKLAINEMSVDSQPKKHSSPLLPWMLAAAVLIIGFVGFYRMDTDPANNRRANATREITMAKEEVSRKVADAVMLPVTGEGEQVASVPAELAKEADDKSDERLKLHLAYEAQAASNLRSRASETANGFAASKAPVVASAREAAPASAAVPASTPAPTETPALTLAAKLPEKAAVQRPAETLVDRPRYERAPSPSIAAADSMAPAKKSGVPALSAIPATVMDTAPGQPRIQAYHRDEAFTRAQSEPAINASSAHPSDNRAGRFTQSMATVTSDSLSSATRQTTTTHFTTTTIEISFP